MRDSALGSLHGVPGKTQEVLIPPNRHLARIDPEGWYIINHLRHGRDGSPIVQQPSSSSLNMTTSLDQLKQTGTVVVSDSGDFEGGLWYLSEFFMQLNSTK
jgi:hypothetical protein